VTDESLEFEVGYDGRWVRVAAWNKGYRIQVDSAHTYAELSRRLHGAAAAVDAEIAKREAGKDEKG
jgi:hypothetical protein